MSLQASGEHFGSNVRVLRRHHGQCQDVLGRRVGVTRTTLRRWEMGERWPTLPLALKLAEALEVELSVLIGPRLVIRRP